VTVERKRFCFIGNGNAVTRVAKATAPKTNCPQHLHLQTETRFMIKSKTGLDKWNMALIAQKNDSRTYLLQETAHNTGAPITCKHT